MRTQPSLHTSGTRVSYCGEAATVTVMPDSDIALTFDDPKRQKLIKPLPMVEAELGKRLHFIQNGKEPAANRLVLSVADMAELKRRIAYVDALKRVSRKGGPGGVKMRKDVIERVSHSIGDRNPVSPAQLARWFTRAQTHSHEVAATLTKPHRNRDSRFRDEIRDFALEAIDDHYLKSGRPTVQYAYDCFSEDFREHFGPNEPRPCRETFRKWIKEMDPVEVIRARDGKRAARAAARNAAKRTPLERILQRVEADALNLALGVVNENGVFLGMITLFVVLDCYSRSVLGLQIQVGRGESAGAVIDSFRHAICPKSQEDLPATVYGHWYGSGAWEQTVTDGGTGYTARDTQSFLLEASCGVQTVETHSGWRKPFIERFFLTLRSQFARTLNGYCGKYADRPDLDATVQEKATMTLDEFRTALIKWIVDEYHHAPHKGLDGNTPCEVWHESAQDWPPQLPINFDRVKAAMGNVRTCAVLGGDASHNGVVIGNIHYNDQGSRLKRIGQRLRRLGRDHLVEVRYSDNDLHHIRVVDPFEDEEFDAFATDPRVTPGMCRAEFNALKGKSYRDKGFGHVRQLANSRAVRQANAAHDAKLKKLSRRLRPVSTDELTDQVKRLREEDEAPTDGRDLDASDTTASGGNEANTPRLFGSEEGFDYE